MTDRPAASRYARALLDVALKESDPQQVERELTSFVDLVRGHDELGKVVVNPAIPAPRKRALVAALAAQAGFSTVTAKLLGLLADRDRLALIGDLLEDYRQRLLDHQQVVRAAVTTAVPLAAESAAALAQAFSRVTGQQVQMTTTVDPAVIGGVVARIGSVVYDGSVKRQLERIRETLTEET